MNIVGNEFKLNISESVNKNKPTDITTADASIRTQLVQFNLHIEMGEQKLQCDNHEKRLQNLRKELSGLKSTEWQYDPIEKYIGQA